MCKFERYRQIGLADFNQPHLQYIRRDRKYLDEFLEKECELTPKQAARLAVIAMNVDRIYRSLLRLFFDIVLPRFKQHNFMMIFIQNTHKKESVSCCAFIIYDLRSHESNVQTACTGNRQDYPFYNLPTDRKGWLYCPWQ